MAVYVENRRLRWHLLPHRKPAHRTIPTDTIKRPEVMKRMLEADLIAMRRPS